MAKKVSFCGVCAALSVVFLYLSMIIKTNSLFFVCFSTLFIALAFMKTGSGGAWCTLAAAALLAFFMLPDKLTAVLFAFVGAYAIVKAYIERIGKLIAEIPLKLLAFAVGIAAVYLLFPTVFLWWYVPAAAVVFVLYDIALSLGITFLRKKFQKIIK